MKRISTLLIIAIIFVISVFAQTKTPTIISSGTCGNNLTWQLTSDSVLTISGTGEMNNFTSSSQPWYHDRTKIKNIIIHDNVTTIGDYAFDIYTSPRPITSITIPNSVTYIGRDAFASCSSIAEIHISDIAKWCDIDFEVSASNPLNKNACLYVNGNKITELVIPEGVDSIKNYAFHNYAQLTSITIPNSVTSIGNDAFRSCSSLTSITIPNSVTSIGNDAFYNCKSLTSITIPNSVTSIGNYAFQYCSSLTSITIPNSVTSIGNAAFSGCSSIAEIHISDIAKWCDIDFKGSVSNPLYNKNACLYVSGNKITELVIPEGVDSIKNYAFYNYAQLTSITIPNSVTSIGSYAFSGCSSLTSITIPNSVTSIGNYAFQSCSSLTSITIPNSVTSIGNYAFQYCSSLTSITIPNSVTSIGGGAFSSCSALTSISIPNSVTSIGGAAFYGTPWLNNQPDGCVYAGSCLYAYKGEMPENTHIDVKEGTTMICNGAFSSCSSLTSITIPNSVTSIGNSAFSNCSSLTSITIPNSVTSIGYGTFSSCSSLTSITIPNSVTSIEDGAFSGCSNIAEIHISDIAKWCDIDFKTFASNNSNPLYNKIACLYVSGNKITELVIPEGVDSIKNYTFDNYTQLTSVTIPNSVIFIDDKAFNGCSGLTSINIEATSPPVIKSNIFPNYKNSITIPCGTLSAYQKYWSEFTNFTEAELSFKLNINTNNNTMGSAEINKQPTCADNTAIITAIPKDNYRFVKWSDEITDNPRTIIVTQDSTLTAIFEWNNYKITTTVNDNAMGSVTESGEYTYGSEITLTATANDGYRFTQWSDGNTENPRTITVTENKTYTAEFKLNLYTLIAHSQNPNIGGVEITLTAKPIKGFEFYSWSDGNTENPRTIILTEDTELYAYFVMSQGGTPVDLETSKISSADIYTQNGTLHVENVTENYHVLDAAGRLIYSGNASTLTLPRGIYLVTINGEIEKIVL